MASTGVGAALEASGGTFWARLKKLEENVNAEDNFALAA